MLFDQQCKDAGHIYFRPARIKGAPYEVHELQGRPIDVDWVLASLPADEDDARKDAGSPPPPNDTGSPPPPPRDTESTPSSKIPLEERERRAIAYVERAGGNQRAERTQKLHSSSP